MESVSWNGDEWELSASSGAYSVDACASACSGKIIGDKPVLGFAFKDNSCWCEANPSHPDPNCMGDVTSVPSDSYTRYDFKIPSRRLSAYDYITTYDKAHDGECEKNGDVGVPCI